MDSLFSIEYFLADGICKETTATHQKAFGPPCKRHTAFELLLAVRLWGHDRFRWRDVNSALRRLGIGTKSRRPYDRSSTWCRCWSICWIPAWYRSRGLSARSCWYRHQHWSPWCRRKCLQPHRVRVRKWIPAHIAEEVSAP